MGKARWATQAVRGVGATIRADGFTWRATRSHMGNNGVKWERFNGEWQVWLKPPRALAMALRANVKIALGVS